MQDYPNNIILVGLMGAGKTTIGRILARKLGMEFIDSDHEIEARTGASVPRIFEIEGEPSFRRREADVIRDLTSRRGIVLATGGGAVLNPDTRALLKERGTDWHEGPVLAPMDIFRKVGFDWWHAVEEKYTGA